MTIRGVLLKKGADQTALNAAGVVTPIVFNDASSEIYDTDGFHESVTNPSRITIPSAVNGKYGIFTSFVSLANLTAVSGTYCVLMKTTGVDVYPYYSGFGSHTTTGGNGQGAGLDWSHHVSAPILLTTNDYYRTAVYTVSDTSIDIKAPTSFGLLVLDNFSPGYCLCKKAADQTTANYSTPAAVAWDGADIIDTYAAHDPSSSNTKIIIPAALNGTYLVFRTNIVMDLVAGNADISVAIRKGSSGSESLTYDGVCAQNSLVAASLSGVVGIHCATQAIQVATGDQFDVLLYSSDTSVTLVAARSTFGFMVVG